MRVSLWHRQYGVHKKMENRTMSIDGYFEDYYLGENNINEDLLLSQLPLGYLPDDPKNILLTVQDVNVDGEETGSTGQRGLKVFRNWAKYFDAYILQLDKCV